MGSRGLRWVLLTLLLILTFFIGSFNATLRFIIDTRRDLASGEFERRKRAAAERKQWKEAARQQKRRERGGAGDGANTKKQKVGAAAGGEAAKGDNAAAKMNEVTKKGHAVAEKIKEVNAAGEGDGKAGAPPKDTGATIQKTPELEEEVAKQTEHLEEQSDELKLQREEEKRKERENPTPGKHRTTSRPLDGFDEVIVDGEGNVETRERPNAQSYGRGANLYSTPRPTGKSSAATLADAHYAKALRMLSSDFDRRKGGGNALPHPVYGGEYDQTIKGKHGRGEEFVRTEARGGKRKRRKKKGTEGKPKKKTTMAEDFRDAMGEDAPGEPLTAAMTALYEHYMDLLDWLHEALGLELDYDEETGDVAHNGFLSFWTSRVRPEEDRYPWRDTEAGRRLLWLWDTFGGLWSRRHSSEASSAAPFGKEGDESSSPTAAPVRNDNVTASLSRQDRLAREGLFHLEKAAELGHAEAQRVVANSLASGILPLSDHGMPRRLAEQRYFHSPLDGRNWTSILLQSTLAVPDDFSSGGPQLSKAVVLWHLSAMGGNVESAMALGYRHLHSATGGTTAAADLVAEGRASAGYHPLTGAPLQGAGGSQGAGSHYGVLGTCPTALAYYEAAANGAMDALEAGPTKGKVNPPLDEHRLAEIYAHGGASVVLESHNKPDELEEALQYYRMLASRSRSPEPDLVAAFTIANFYYNGYRGVKQDLRLALKYYEICGDHNHWEGGGQAGLMHVWGLGMTADERDLGKAYAYFAQGTPGGLDGCQDRLRRKKKRQNQKKDGEAGEEVHLCDRHSINGMGLLHLLGVDGLVDRDVGAARRWFEHGKDFGDAESMFNYAMLRLGWMVTELDDLPAETVRARPPAGVVPGYSNRQPRAATVNYVSYRSTSTPGPLDFDTGDVYRGPSASDYNVALQELTRAAQKGHIQARHRLGLLHASGAHVPNASTGRAKKVIAQNCQTALRYYKLVADGGHTISRRNRAAWKQYNAGEYESALRNYLASAESGSEVGQVNAAFLLEQGHCLGMPRGDCTRASVRLWRAAARQGSLEACLRVGDFYYYGRMRGSAGGDARLAAPPPVFKKDEEGGETATLYDREEFLASLERKAFYFVPGPYRWARYVLYPEELLDMATKWASRAARDLGTHVKARLSDSPVGDDKAVEVEAPQEGACDEADGTCSADLDQHTVATTDTYDHHTDHEDDEHMAIAAQYYRKAAEEHESARANFNLGFMHEWGLGLTQDFPLAKRHYDLAAGKDSGLAATIALKAMGLHQRLVRLGMAVREEDED
ncbi:hypothetical protein ACHAXT_004239 [Thalassiosira profunda]